MSVVLKTFPAESSARAEGPFQVLLILPPGGTDTLGPELRERLACEVLSTDGFEPALQAVRGAEQPPSGGSRRWRPGRGHIAFEGKLVNLHGRELSEHFAVRGEQTASPAQGQSPRTSGQL